MRDECTVPHPSHGAACAHRLLAVFCRYQIDCATAAKGSVCPAGSEKPIECEPGTMAAQATDDACTPCEAGKHCPNKSTAKGSELECKKGSYCGAGSKSATACPSGHYCPTPANKIECTAKGSYCVGAVTEALCPAGSYCPDAKTKADCEAGSFCPEGSTKQAPCTAGFFCSKDATTQTPCKPGEYCPAKTVEGGVTKCPVGHYGPNPAKKCEPCKVGEAQPLEGKDKCEPCDAGKYVPAAGSLSKARSDGGVDSQRLAAHSVRLSQLSDHQGCHLRATIIRPTVPCLT